MLGRRLSFWNLIIICGHLGASLFKRKRASFLQQGRMRIEKMYASSINQREFHFHLQHRHWNYTYGSSKATTQGTSSNFILVTINCGDELVVSYPVYTLGLLLGFASKKKNTNRSDPREKHLFVNEKKRRVRCGFFQEGATAPMKNHHT